MSLNAFKKATELIRINKDDASFCKGVEDEIINFAEDILNLQFPQSYKLFLKEYGAGNFRSAEFYGIIRHPENDPEMVPNGIWLTLNERNNSGLPKELIIIGSTGMGEYYVLNTSKFNNDSESPVEIWSKNLNDISRLENISESFGDFFLRKVTFTLS